MAVRASNTANFTYESGVNTIHAYNGACTRLQVVMQTPKEILALCIAMY